MKKIIFSLIGLALMFSLVGVAGANGGIYTQFIDQGIVVTPLEEERAYYPSVIFDGINYFMVYDNKTTEGNVGNYATSDDGVNWVLGGSISGVKDNNHSYHTVMLYDSDGFGGEFTYKIWYLDLNAEIAHGANSIRYAESTDGIHWENDQAVFGGNMIVPGDDNVDAPARTWGPGTVIYNSDANNIGNNPLDYSYVMYYDGYNGNTDDPDWDNTEALFLAYSPDGINWSRYTRNPVLKGSITSGWDATCVGYPTVIKIEDGSYVMWYSGGFACNEGIGFAISPDAINWTKDNDNPIFHKSDTTNPPGYRAERTYTPRVINDGSGELKMYYSAKSDIDIYAIGLAILELPLPRSAEITSPKIDEIVYNEVKFAAYLVDNDSDYVDWAVRKGTCAAGTNTVFGNVDGHHDAFDISYNSAEYKYSYLTTADVSAWAPGMYCFIFNPREDAGEANIRLTREFYIADGYVKGGGQIREYLETGKSKDDYKISFGGQVWDLGLEGYMGDWQINFHNVGDDDYDKAIFHATEVSVINFYSGNSGTCDEAMNMTLIGTLNGEEGYSVIFRAGDYGTGRDHETADTIRVELFENNSKIYDTHFVNEFTDESSCVGTARTGLDAGNIIIEYK